MCNTYVHIVMHVYVQVHNYFTGGEDYEVPPNQYIKVIIPAGMTRISFDIKITDDNKVEYDETFRGTIFDLSLPYGFNLGSIASATFTILDGDSKLVYLYMYNI